MVNWQLNAQFKMYKVCLLLLNIYISLVLIHFYLLLVGERKVLKKDAVPSVFSFKTPGPKCASSRRERYRKRATCTSISVPEKRTCLESPHDDNIIFPDIEVEEQELKVSTSVSESLAVKPKEAVQQEKQFKDCATQCVLLTDDVKTKITIESLKEQPEMVNYYTGFSNYAHFMLFFNVLGDCVHHLHVPDCFLHPKDQLLLTLMKLRQAKDDLELAFLFGLRRTAVSSLTLTWIKFLYFQLKEININPSKQVVQQHMPKDFKKQFPSTRMIIDGTEVPIQKPSKVDLQSATFSTYKNRNTLKVLVGCTPKGQVSYVSDAYGGCASDRQICERSELLHNPDKFDRGDSIMADRGFTVQDLFATKDVAINMPSFLKGKSQLSSQEVIKDRRIASKRIHVERIIGLAKTYKILKRELPVQRVPLGSYIISVCFHLVNFKNCIVSNNM